MVGRGFATASCCELPLSDVSLVQTPRPGGWRLPEAPHSRELGVFSAAAQAGEGAGLADRVGPVLLGEWGQEGSRKAVPTSGNGLAPRSWS